MENKESKDIDRKFDKAEESVVDHNNLRQELIHTNRHVETATKELGDATKNWKKNIEELAAQVNKLRDESFILYKVPEEMAKSVDQSINRLAPEISKSILLVLRKEMLQEFDKNVQFCNIKIKELEGKIGDVIQRVNSQENISFGKKALVFMALLFLSTISTLGISYSILEKFPRFIKIETEGNINIENSKSNNISVWDAKAVKEALKKKK